MFQDSLNTYLISKLNENTQELTFKGDYMFMVDSGKFVIKTQTGFSITETNYIPVQIQDWRNTPQPFQRVDLQDIVAPISLAIRQTQLADGLLAIEEFRSLVNGSSATIDGLNVGFKVGQPSPPSSPQIHAGEHWVLIDIIVALSAGANLTFGNSVDFSIAKTTETLQKIIYSKIDIATVAATDTSVDDYIVSVGIGKSTQTITIDILYENNITISTEFLNNLWQSTSPNQKYDVSVKYSDSITKTGTYVITNNMQHIENGVVVGFALTLNKANG